MGYFREQRKMQKKRAVSIAVLLWGMILLCLSIALIPEAFPWTFFLPLRLLNALLYAVWALVLLRFGVKNLRAISQTQQNGRS
jgi:hypothetical protein